MKKLAVLAAALLMAAPLAVSQNAWAESDDIGSVNTAFKLLGPDHKIIVSAFDDPDIPGVACHVARAKTGGISGALGVAEDTADASIACRQVGPITMPAKLPEQKEVFDERRSFVFKHLRVVRFFDKKRNTLVYLAYSDKLVDGSPKNSLSTVPVMPWR